MVKQDRHAEDLVAALRKKYGSLQAFERLKGLPLNTVSTGLRRPYIAVEEAVAAALDTSPVAIWPSRYHPDGTRRSPQPAENYRR